MITIKITNNAGGLGSEKEHTGSLLEAHLLAERTNNWPANQTHGSYAVVHVDGVAQMTRLDQWYLEDCQARRCDATIPTFDDAYVPQIRRATDDR